MGKKETITEGDIAALLRVKYPAPAWATMFNVGNGTGMACNRRADCIAVSCWASKGALKIHGHEIKVSRSDWLREIQDVTKAEAFAQHCHYWWIVAPTGIVKLEELPPAWGLMQRTNQDGLRVAKPAGLRSDASLTYSFLSSLCRAAVDQSDTEKAIEKAYQRGWSEATKRAEQRADVEVRMRAGKIDQRLKAVDAFEAASGLKIGSWDAGDIGLAVKLLMRCTPGDIAKTARSAIGSVDLIRDRLEKLAGAMEATEPTNAT